MSFAELKRSRSNFDKLTKELQKTTSTPEARQQIDDRFWKPELDKSGNGYSVIRFLPAPQEEELPWARLWSHAFQGPGGWYIENSLTTIAKKDPVSEDNTRLWNTGADSDKDIARKRKRKLSYITNIKVITDPTRPENEGKVFLYKFGKKIFDKITETMQPQFEDEKAINPFDFWEGANFKLKIRKVDGFWNYDIENIWKKQHKLKDFLAPLQFKPYDELKAKFERVVYGTGNTATAEGINTPPVISESVTVVSEPEKKETKVTTSPTAKVDDEDDTMSYFSKLVEEN